MIDRLVWLDYRKALSWKKLSKKLLATSGFVFMNIYMLSNIPLITLELEGMEYIPYYCAVIPMIFSMWSAMYVEIKLPKQMFLNPITQEERREYMNKLLTLKIALPNMIMALIMGVIVLLGMTQPLVAIATLIENILMTLGFGLLYVRDSDKKQAPVTCECNFGWFLTQMLISIFTEIGCVYFLSIGELVGTEIWITYGVLVMIQLLLLYKIYSYKDDYFNKQSDYENAYVIQEEKVKKEVKSVW